MNEADTCRKFVVPKLQAAGWDNEPHSITLRARTEAIAKHLTDFLKKHDRFTKTVVFCVDQEHADEVRRALNNLNSDLTGANNAAQASPPAGSGDVPSPGHRGGTPLQPAAGTAALHGFPDYVCRVTSDDGDIGRGQHGPEARQILDELLEKYAEHGAAQFVLPDVLKVPPVSDHGQIGDIMDKLRGAVNELQTLLYAA